jgi:hypothetical protein
MKLFAHTRSSTAAFPTTSIGRHLHHVFRGLLGVYSHYNLHAHGAAKTALCIEGSDDFVTSAAASIVTGWNEPVPGRDYTPLKRTAFHGARCRSRWVSVGITVAGIESRFRRDDYFRFGALSHICLQLFQRHLPLQESRPRSRPGRSQEFDGHRVCLQWTSTHRAFSGKRLDLARAH